MNEYSIRQIAELLKVSKPTVQKIANRLEIKPSRIDDETNRRYYNLEDTERIIAEKEPNFDFAVLRKAEKIGANTAKEPQNFAESGAKGTANTAKEPQNFAESTEKPQNVEGSSEIELLKHTLAIIEKQLEEKDKQLSIKDKQIQDLSDRLAEAMQLTKGQQYIAAADKATELIEVDNKAAGEQQKKKSFWKRLFNR